MSLDDAKRPELPRIDRARLQRSAAHAGTQDRGQDHGDDADQGVAILHRGRAADRHPR